MSDKTLTADTLRGVWALTTTPWDEKDNFDEETFRHDVAYQCRSGVHGLYTTGSSGECYALEFDEFCRLVDAFMDEVNKTGIPHQIGCTWTDTKGTLRRAEYAVKHGAGAIQVAFPYYIKLALNEGINFFKDLAGVCGDIPLIHYNTSHAKLVLEAEDYKRLKEQVPTLIGTKLARGEPLWVAEVCEKVPELSHFSGEYTFAPDFAGGARGIYSWLAVTNPRFMLAWYDACCRGDWARAVEMQVLVNRYKIHVKKNWHGQNDAAVNKADAALNPNIRCGLRVRSPYTSCTPDDIKLARAWIKENLPELAEL